jgi:hypothetical protein
MAGEQEASGSYISHEKMNELMQMAKDGRNKGE